MARSRFSDLDFSNSSYINEYLKRTKPKPKAPAPTAGCSLYYMREVELEPTLAVRLLPFIRSYAPFQPLPTPAELRAEGYVKVEEMSFLEECEEIYFENHGYYPNDKPEDTE